MASAPSSAQLAPSVAALKAERTMTPTPLAPSVSKRDRRRTALAERLSDVTETFARTRDSHFRRQLQTIQADMTMIMKVDPYQPRPMDDQADDILSVVASTLAAGVSPADVRELETEVSPMAGKWFAKFVAEVNDDMEDRDASLTLLHRNQDQALRKLELMAHYKIRFAFEEDRILATALRERLSQNIGYRKSRLLREKEQLDLADSNALLLHPSQFSITNPASPGGAQSNRKTRNTRHRGGDMDEIGGSYGVGETTNKRKRKGVQDDGDVEGPAPKQRALENGAASPHRDSRFRNAIPPSANGSPYSVDRLFSEKDLAVTHQAASVATVQYFADIKARWEEMAMTGLANGGSHSSNAVNGPNTGGGSHGHGHGHGHEGENGDDSTLLAPEMDRTVSQSYHATRSSRHALNLLSDAAASQRIVAPFGLAVPPVIPSSLATKAGITAPLPTGLSAEEIDEDRKKIARLMAGPSGSTDERLLDQIHSSLENVAPFDPSTVFTSLDPGPFPAPSSAVSLRIVTSGDGGGRGVDADGGIPMSKQSSVGGASDAGLGPVPMSRAGSSRGSKMKRTASGMGQGPRSKRSR
ncbi:MAG: hypothetical protein M1826_003154 [Phylliscum demangeonii]|nr:MAG: hypothetical protein M1826_003154 [Phylliscum demangeonii]